MSWFSKNKKLLGGIGLLGLGATGFGLAGAGPLAGMLAGEAAAVPAGAEALPSLMETMSTPAVGTMDAMTLPEGVLPADPLKWSTQDELASLGARGGDISPSWWQKAQQMAASDKFGQGLQALRLGASLESQPGAPQIQPPQQRPGQFANTALPYSPEDRKKYGGYARFLA